MRALGKSAAAGLTAAALIFTGAGLAIASGVDSSVVDTTAPTGSVSVNAGASTPIVIKLTVTGNQVGTATFEVYRDWSLAGGVFSGSNSQQFTVSPRAAQDAATTFTTTGTVSVAAAQATGTFPLSVPAFDITNSNGTGAKLGAGQASSYSVTVLGAPTNNAPTAPGAPGATSPTQGGFSLSWAPSTDAENDAVTYTLEGKDADDADFAQVAAGLASPSYTFAAGAPAEGTWTYRVKAVETSTSPALGSGWSPVSSAIVVDRTKPNAPTASTDRPADYTDASTGAWWKDTVTVSFAGNGDPALPDGSAGSGVASVSDSQSFDATGPFTATGTATDNVGLVSLVTSFGGSVDAAAPVVSLTCPTGSVVKGSTAYATWTASDEGSGLATAASGQIALDTSAIGTHSISAPAGTALDNVGHPSAASAACDYSVVYDFRGFFQPVDMDKTNVAKAGSSIPIKFSLNGYQGMDIIAAGYPTFTITGGSVTGDAVEETVTAGGSTLSYDPVADQYVYVWKTDKAWAGKSGTFTLRLADGTDHTAKFSFKK